MLFHIVLFLMECGMGGEWKGIKSVRNLLLQIPKVCIY